jgi:hypothetical protein
MYGKRKIGEREYDAALYGIPRVHVHTAYLHTAYDLVLAHGVYCDPGVHRETVAAKKLPELLNINIHRLPSIMIVS